jgi:hypothetical protein
MVPTVSNKHRCGTQKYILILQTARRQQTTGSRQQIADSRQQTADSKQQTADSKEQTADTDLAVDAHAEGLA